MRLASSCYPAPAARCVNHVTAQALDTQSKVHMHACRANWNLCSSSCRFFELDTSRIYHTAMLYFKVWYGRPGHVRTYDSVGATRPESAGHSGLAPPQIVNAEIHRAKILYEIPVPVCLGTINLGQGVHVRLRTEAVVRAHSVQRYI